MKIINLKAENYKRLRAVNITPTDNVVPITGGNAQGKSSVLDAITAALCGGKEIPEVPVRKGSSKGNIVLDLGEYLVTRTFTSKGSYLKIENKDGVNISSPQKLLDQIVGKISFDPLAFLEENDKKKQRSVLLAFLGINTDDLDKQEKDLRAKRTTEGQQLDKAKGHQVSLQFYPDRNETAEINVEDLVHRVTEGLKEKNAWQKKWDDNEELKRKGQADEERANSIRQQIDDLQLELKSLENHIETKKQEYRETKETLNNQALPDVDALNREISDVSETNRQIRANMERRKATALVDGHTKTYNYLTKQIEDIVTERQTLITNAQMPIPGLSFDDDQLLYNSLPLDQASSAERLKISLAISMALNPTLKVLRIKDGSLLDSKNREIIKQMVKEKDYQLWVESVDESGKVGIYIEDGEVKEVNDHE